MVSSSNLPLLLDLVVKCTFDLLSIKSLVSDLCFWSLSLFWQWCATRRNNSRGCNSLSANIPFGRKDDRADYTGDGIG